ncbi:hypothetical protein ACJJIK_20900 [Microbulbifer sp. ZKSA006]
MKKLLNAYPLVSIKLFDGKTGSQNLVLKAMMRTIFWLLLKK